MTDKYRSRYVATHINTDEERLKLFQKSLLFVGPTTNAKTGEMFVTIMTKDGSHVKKFPVSIADAEASLDKPINEAEYQKYVQAVEGK